MLRLLLGIITRRPPVALSLSEFFGVESIGGLYSVGDAKLLEETSVEVESILGACTRPDKEDGVAGARGTGSLLGSDLE